MQDEATIAYVEDSSSYPEDQTKIISLNRTGTLTTDSQCGTKQLSLLEKDVILGLEIVGKELQRRCQCLALLGANGSHT